MTESTELPHDSQSPSKIKKELENMIAELYVSGNIQKADSLCETNGIDKKQFGIYHDPQKDEKDDVVFNMPTKNITIYHSDKQVQGVDGAPVFLHRTFPYSIEEVLKLKKPTENDNHFRNIALGIHNSYSSRNLMCVFNIREYLGMMSEIPALKKEKESYLNDINKKIIENEENEEKEVHDILKIFVHYLINSAYNLHEWDAKSRNLKDIFSIKYQNLNTRINLVPIADREEFINSMMNKSFVEPNDFDNRSKEWYATKIVQQLEYNWQNFPKEK